MFEKNMHYAYLLDIYSGVLDEHTKNIMEAYYEDDLSLSEIALGEDISRQGVRHIIKKAEDQLDFLDEKLKLSEHFSNLDEIVKDFEQISDALSKCNDETVRGYAEKINLSLHKLIKE